MLTRSPAFLPVAAIALFFASTPGDARAAEGTHPSIKLTPGVYHCDMNRRVELRQVADDKKSAILYWERRNYTLHAVSTQTGALRLEDKTSGLTWIVIPGKSMLLDTRLGRQLANDCRA